MKPGWPALLLGLVVCAVAGLSTFSTAGVAAGGDRPRVLVAPIEGAIDPVTKAFVQRTLRRAQDNKYDAVVFTMDTPGGLSTSMTDIIKEILAAKDLPVIVYVSPSGGRAASAGAFILMASDVAAMAPNTNVGSATPIQGNGSDVGKDLRKKVLNDAVAQIRALAREHDRDQEFAEAAVRDAENIDEAEAKTRGVIEFVAPDLPTLLDEIDGFKTTPKGLTVETKDASITRTEVPLHLRILKGLIDPNILFLLFSAGLLGLAFEIFHPGAIAPGVVGTICLVLALFGFQILPINIAGLVLMGIAFALFLLEAFVMSHGVLGAGGAVALVVGGLLLFDNDSEYGISPALLVLTALAIAGFFAFIMSKAYRARKGPVATGLEAWIGRTAVVRSALTPTGTLSVDGEIWNARMTDPEGAAAVDERVRVVAADGLTLIVEPLTLAESFQGPNASPDTNTSPEE